MSVDLDLLTRDRLPRPAKILMDREGVDLDAAIDRVARTCLPIVVEPRLVTNRLVQIALLVAVTTGRRSFGNVFVDLVDDAPLLVRWPQRVSLLAALAALGAKIGKAEGPPLVISESRLNVDGVRLMIDGACAGVAPADLDVPFDLHGYAPAAATSASFAVLDIFDRVVLGDAAAGTRERRVLLDAAEAEIDWSTEDHRLPQRLAFLGLGHLGQGALFVSSLLGSVDDDREYWLQDYDHLVSANHYTQVLVEKEQVGLKTTVCAAWLAARGIAARERPEAFDPSHVRLPGEPDVYIAGFDKLEPRRALDALDASFVVDAGIGDAENDFTAFRIHCFPQRRPPSEVFPVSESLDEHRARESRARKYARFSDDAKRRCGLVEAGAVAVGVPCVGTAIASIVLSQIIRHARDGRYDATVTGDLLLRNPARTSALDL